MKTSSDRTPSRTFSSRSKLKLNIPSNTFRLPSASVIVVVFVLPQQGPKSTVLTLVLYFATYRLLRKKTNAKMSAGKAPPVPNYALPTVDGTVGLQAQGFMMSDQLPIELKNPYRPMDLTMATPLQSSPFLSSFRSGLNSMFQATGSSFQLFGGPYQEPMTTTTATATTGQGVQYHYLIQYKNIF